MLAFSLLSCISSFTILFTNTPPIIDGKFSEKEWGEEYLLVDSMLQKEPMWAKAASEITKVYMGYNKEAVYIAIRCFDRDISKLKATARERDSKTIEKDDHIFILLDTFNDGVNGYGFFINPLGTQKDMKIAGCGNILYPEWDAEWESYTSMKTDEWIVEIKIPFSEIAYGGEKWRINFARWTSRNQEYDVWSLTSSIFEVAKGRVVELEKGAKIEKTREILLIPHGVMRKENNDYQILWGGDLRLNMGKSHRFDFAYNMDYAELEADIDYIDLDQLPLYLSEKRPFFLEGGEHLIDNLGLLYTRAITDIFVGGKYIGKIGPCNINSFVLHDKEKEITYSVVRPKFSLSNQNEIGSIITYAEGSNNTINEVVSFDGTFTLPKDIHLVGQVASSNSINNSSKEKGLSYCISGWRTPQKGLRLSFYYKDYEPDFYSITGYIPLPGLNQFGIMPQYVYYPTNTVLHSISATLPYRNWKINNKPFIEEIIPYIKAKFRNKWAVMIGMYFTERVFTQTYYDKYGFLRFTYKPGGWNKIGLSCSYGKYLGYDMIYPSLSLKVKPHKKLETALDLEYQYLTSKETTKKTLILAFRGGWQITDPFTVKYFVQWSDISEEVEMRFLLKYDFSARSHIYLGINSSSTTAEINYEELAEPKNYEVLLKMVYSLPFGL